VTTVFNCAPAYKNLDPEFRKYTDLLVVNESEAEALTGLSVSSLEEGRKACEALLSEEGYSVGVIVTLGNNGALLAQRSEFNENVIIHFAAPKIKAVDSIGAGDAFVGSLAHYLSIETKSSNHQSKELHKAIRLSVEYASLSVERKGAQASYLSIHELDEKFKN
jgi:ribokinase